MAPLDEPTPSSPGLLPSPLPAFLERIAALPREFVIHDDGWRGWPYTYAEIARMAAHVMACLEDIGAKPGDHLLVWSESRPGWLAVLQAALLRGFVVVPVEPQSSLALCQRIAHEVAPVAFFLGDLQDMPTETTAPLWRLRDIEQGRRMPATPQPSPRAGDTAEIVFTSGTTSSPKGVVMTHRNLSASIEPIERALAPYRKYLRYFEPLRILDLLPMSHLFGQAMAMFIVPTIPATVVFLNTTNPEEIARQIKRRRICAVVSVPRVLELLRDFVLLRFPETTSPLRKKERWQRRWWRYRAVHRFFGWRFCCFVVGGAPLAAEVEEFWLRLGFVVAQGYGLTETAPIISFNHPFHSGRASAGRPMSGTEVKIADDGEILVRGHSVTPGYYHQPQQTSNAFTDGWLRTGDIGALTESGDLVIRGRKKDVIVTPEGLKVHPEDVEAVLHHIAGVRESAVIERSGVHAVLVLAAGSDPEQILRSANEQLEPHQRIRSYSLWSGAELPRTPTTRKIKRSEIAAALRGEATPSGPAAADSVLALLRKRSPGRTVRPESTLDELGLTSLDRVELMLELEEKFDIQIDEDALSSIRTVGELEHAHAPTAKELKQPRYSRTRIAAALRRILLPGFLLPLTRVFAKLSVCGLENLDGLSGPVLFTANHVSLLDGAAIFAALPPRFRYRTAPAMWLEQFNAHFFPEKHGLGERAFSSTLYYLSTLLFSTFPLSQSEHGTRQSLRYAGELVEDGWSILIFPEGARSRTGELGALRPGAAMIATRMRIPVVPIRLVGLERVLPPGWRWPRRGPVEVHFGQAFSVTDADSLRATAAIRQAMESL